MNIKRTRPAIQKSRLENEVILAVILLYVLLSAVMLAIHHIQPSDIETITSSTSPAHDERDAETAEAVGEVLAPLSLASAEAVLLRSGYQEISELRAQETIRARALMDGKVWNLEIDPTTAHITRMPGEQKPEDIP